MHHVIGLIPHTHCLVFALPKAFQKPQLLFIAVSLFPHTIVLTRLFLVILRLSSEFKDTAQLQRYSPAR